MQIFEVNFYKKQDETCPLTQFLDSLEPKMRAKVLRSILLLEQNGNELREPYSKPLEDGIFELRIQQSSNISRVLYFFMNGNNIIITHGFIKKHRKPPEVKFLLQKNIAKTI